MCPHRGVTFNQAQELFSALPAAGPVEKSYRLKKCNQKDCNLVVSHFLSTVMEDGQNPTYKANATIWLLPVRQIPRLSGTYESVFTLERVAVALHGLDIPMCPHIRLDQSIVLARFNPRCLFRYEPDACSSGQITQQVHRLLCRQCTSCRQEGLSTSFQFIVVERAGAAALGLCVSRDLGSLDAPTDPAWLNYSLDPRKFEDTASILREWTLHIHEQRRKCLQETINLSHPIASFVSPKNPSQDRRVTHSGRAKTPLIKARKRALSWLQRTIPQGWGRSKPYASGEF